jgi:hypothetical protein
MHQPVLCSQSRQGSYSGAFAHAESRLAEQPKISTCRHRAQRPLNTAPIPSHPIAIRIAISDEARQPYHHTGPGPDAYWSYLRRGVSLRFRSAAVFHREPRGRPSRRVSFPVTAIGRLESNTTPDTPQTQRVARRNAAGLIPQRHPRRTETDRWGWPQVALARQCAPRGKCLTRYSLHPQRTF